MITFEAHTIINAPAAAVWATLTDTGGMPLGLFKGERTYRLENVPAGTQVTMREEFSGPMLKLIALTLPDLQPSFEQFVGGLKAVVELMALPQRPMSPTPPREHELRPSMLKETARPTIRGF